jgi:hypothetical protein
LSNPLIVLGAMIGLLVARLSVSAVLIVAVPLVLSVLSVVFGPALRRAARACRNAGVEAQRALRETARRIRRTARDSHQDRWRRRKRRLDRRERRRARTDEHGRPGGGSDRWRVPDDAARRDDDTKSNLESDLEQLVEDQLEKAADDLERRFTKRGSR